MAIIKSYIREFTMDTLKGFILSFLIAFLSLVLAMVVSRMFFKKNVIWQFCAAFSNAGFIGIPLVQMALGDEAVFYVASFVALLNILQWTYGVYIFTEDKEVVSLKKIATNPIVVSWMVGVLLFILPGSGTSGTYHYYVGKYEWTIGYDRAGNLSRTSEIEGIVFG